MGTVESAAVQALHDLAVRGGDSVRPEHIGIALTSRCFVYDDGATQTFEADGGTTYIAGQQRSRGEWWVDGEGRFCSFWPPSHRACYDLHWIAEDGVIVGLRFTERERGSVFIGRYR